MRKYFRVHFPWQLLMILIFIQSSIPRITLPDLGFDWQDKLLHFTVYGILSALLVRGMRESVNQLFKKYHLLLSIIFTSVYGLSDEVHQYFVPGRSSELSDWLADTTGAVVIIACYYLYRKLKNIRQARIEQQL